MRKSFLLISLAVLLGVPGWSQAKRQEYALYLTDAPVAERYQRRQMFNTPEALTYRRQIEDRQQALKAELGRRNFHVIGSVSTLLNAVFVKSTPDRLAELRSLPGVTAVRPMLPGKKLLNQATQLMNAPAAWSQTGGAQNAGAGMKIGILDTGIDQNHPAFQNSNLTMPAGFPKCTDGHPEDCAYTNNKVIVARSYVREISGTDPTTSTPDDFSPRDRDGHGTGMASVAAADQNTGTVTFTGMAPGAYLGNYKIFGSPGVNDFGSTAIWILALDDAVKDGMDVVNLSSGAVPEPQALQTGGACGLPAPTATNPEYCDPLVNAFEMASQAGVVITVSAGNGGSSGLVVYPNYNSITSPGIAPSVITAGATTNSHVMQPAVSVTGDGVPTNLQGIPGQYGDSYIFPFPGSLGAAQAPLVDITSLGDNGFACSALPVNSLSGAFALLQNSNTGSNSATPCDWVTQTTNLGGAGAIGAVFYQSTPAAPINPENTFGVFGPVVMISNAAGVALKSFIDSNPGRIVTIDAAGVEQSLSAYSQNYFFNPPEMQNQVASYSSFGPAVDGSIKPDLVATGGFDPNQIPDLNDPLLPAPHGMYEASQRYDPAGIGYTTNGYVAADGTSNAAPLAAGAAAIVKQLHPGLTAAQIKSVLVNSVSSASLNDDGSPTTGAHTLADVERAGAGLLDAGAAALAATGATVTSEPATVSFGILTSSLLPITKNLTITNKGTSSVTLTASVVQNTPVGGTTVAATAPGPLAAGAAGTLSVVLSGAVPSPGEYSGFVLLQGAGVSLRIPYMYLVGDGVAANLQMVYGGGFSGTPGQDVGPVVVQVVDKYGVPVTSYPVTFNAESFSSSGPDRSLSFQSVSGVPPCTAGSSGYVCNTDSYGFAWIDVILGRSTGFSNVIFSTDLSACSVNAFNCPGYQILTAPAITVAGVVDPVAYSQPIAPGSYISIFGSNLVDPGLVFDTTNGDSAIALPSGALPLFLDGTTVSFDVPSAGISVPGYMYYVGPPDAMYPQINLWVPRALQGQSSVQVKVTVDELVFGNVVTIPLTDYAPVFFANGGFLSARDSTANENIITASNPATRGQAVLLFANGMGPVTNPPADGDAASGVNLSHTTTDPVVMIGNQPAQLLFSGLAPGFAGLYQVNVVVPTNIGTGPQPVSLSIGGKTTPAGMLYVQ